MKIKEIVREIKPEYAGLILIALIWIWAFLTARDQFWAGRAAFFSAFVIFAVAVYRVMENVEEH